MKLKANHLIAGLLLIAGAPSAAGPLLIAGAPSAAGPSPSEAAPETQPDRVVLARVVRDICPKRVAMLGEATHGDGATVAFKVALVRELIGKCHFNAVFFEASHYDFLEFSRRLQAGEPTSPDMIASAAGGLWKFDREFLPLMPFLYAEARAGRVALGGIDDQLGSAGSFYSHDTMPEELAGYLAEPRRAACRDLLRKRIYYQFPHYGVAARQQLSQCVSEIETALAAMKEPAGKPALHKEMLAGIERLLSRDLAENIPNISGRDRSMYLNFRWLARRLPPNSKIIVWTATIHAAKDATADPEIGAAGVRTRLLGAGRVIPLQPNGARPANAARPNRFAGKPRAGRQRRRCRLPRHATLAPHRPGAGAPATGKIRAHYLGSRARRCRGLPTAAAATAHGWIVRADLDDAASAAPRPNPTDRRANATRALAIRCWG